MIPHRWPPQQTGLCGAFKSAKGRVFPRRHTEEELLSNNSGVGRPVFRDFLKSVPVERKQS